MDLEAARRPPRLDLAPAGIPEVSRLMSICQIITKCINCNISKQQALTVSPSHAFRANRSGERVNQLLDEAGIEYKTDIYLVY